LNVKELKAPLTVLPEEEDDITIKGSMV